MPVACIDFGGTTIKVGLLDGARVLASRSFPTVGSSQDLRNVRNAVDDMLYECTAAALGDRSAISGVGIAMPGVVDQQRGALIAAHDKYRYAIGMNVRAWAEQEFGAPAAIENDARAALIGEARHGCARNERDAVLIILGTGIGTAALLDGRLLRGAHDHAGILGGHVTVELDGPVCNCGNIGCAEAVASTWALERSIREHPRLGDSRWSTALRSGQPLELKDLIDSRDDVVSRDILDRFIRAWGAAIIGLCHAYDPNLVVVSGGVMRSADVILPQLTAYVHDHLWSSSFRPPLVTPSAPDHSVLLGLSALCDGDNIDEARQDQAID
jgi:glucokinase